MPEGASDADPTAVLAGHGDADPAAVLAGHGDADPTAVLAAHWNESERRLYPTATTNPDAYQSAVRLVRAVADALADVPDLGELVQRWECRTAVLDAAVSATGENKLYLEGARLNPVLAVTNSLGEALEGAEVVVWVCPVQYSAALLAEAGPALGRPDYTAAGARAASFLLETVRRGDRLLRVFAAGRAHIDGFLEDYGALGNACMSLYEATLDARWLTEATRIADATVAHFWSPAEQVFHDAPADGEALVVRPRDIMDNATPSGNSLAVELLVRLAAITGSAAHGEIAEAVFARERGTMERYPSAVGRLLTAAVQHLIPRLEITLVGSPPALSGMLDVAHRHPHPNRVIAGGDPEDPAIAALAAMEGRLDRAGQAFVCIGTTCREPVSTPQALAAALARAQSDSPPG